MLLRIRLFRLGHRAAMPAGPVPALSPPTRITARRSGSNTNSNSHLRAPAEHSPRCWLFCFDHTEVVEQVGRETLSVLSVASVSFRRSCDQRASSIHREGPLDQVHEDRQTQTDGGGELCGGAVGHDCRDGVRGGQPAAKSAACTRPPVGRQGMRDR
jgi:hypothetical protein